MVSQNAPVVREWVGLRPVRSAVRIEHELMKFPSGNLQVLPIHCICIFGTGFSNTKIPVFYKFWFPKLPINLVQCKVMFTVVCTVSSTTVFERFLCAYYVLIMCLFHFHMAIRPLWPQS